MEEWIQAWLGQNSVQRSNSLRRSLAERLPQREGKNSVRRRGLLRGGLAQWEVKWLRTLRSEKRTYLRRQLEGQHAERVRHGDLVQRDEVRGRV